MDSEQLEQESRLFPWLDSDCMSDQRQDFFDALNQFEDYEEEE